MFLSYLGLTVQRVNTPEHVGQIRFYLSGIRHRVRARRQARQIRQLHRIRSTYYHLLHSRQRGMEITQYLRRKRSTN